jgi:hypothetical protein
MAATRCRACRRCAPGSRRSTFWSWPTRIPPPSPRSPSAGTAPTSLPICTQFETRGSRTASNRSLQWGHKIVDPIFESKDDYEAMYLLARKLGIAEEMFKHIAVEGTVPSAEDILREINRGTWSIGYTGQSPERLKLHLEHQADFDMVTLRGKPGTPVENEFYGLPWPCWGTPELKHPGTHVLYNTHEHVMNGGGTFRARFGVEREGETLLAEGSWSVARRSRTAIRSSPSASSRRSAGTPTSPPGAQGHRADRRRERRQRLLGNRPLGRHPAGRPGARLQPLRQRQGPGGGLESAGPGPGAPRAHLQPQARSRGRVPDLRGRATSAS